MTDDERIAYLAGDDVASLELRRTSRARRAAQPARRSVDVGRTRSAALQQRVVDGIAAAAAQPRPAGATCGPRAVDRPGRASFEAAPVRDPRPAAAVAACGRARHRPSRSCAVRRQPHAVRRCAHRHRRWRRDANGPGDAHQDHGRLADPINATGLPRRDNGAYYEAWLKNAAGVLVPIGTFNQPAERHPVVRRAAVAIPHPDRHPPASSAAARNPRARSC